MSTGTARAALVQRLLGERGIVRAPTEAIRALPRDATLQRAGSVGVRQVSVFATSFAQDLMWFNAQIEGDSSFYNVGVEIDLIGAVDESALRSTLNALVERHEPLRTTFATIEGTLKQLVWPAEPVELAIHDLCGEAPEGVESALLGLVQGHNRQIDLENGPIFRCAMARLPGGTVRLFMTLHHLCADGWAMELLTRDFCETYAAIALKRAVPPVRTKHQYADFSVWQRERLTEEYLRGHLDYWRKQLADAPRSISLPADLTLPRSKAGAEAAAVMPAVLYQRLQQSARQRGMTPFAFLLAALYAALSRWTRQTDLVVGSVLANRDSQTSEDIVGNFVNFVALRGRVRSESTLDELLAETKHDLAESFSHGECPFDLVVDALRVDAQESRRGLYNVAFLLQNHHRAPESLDLPIRIAARPIKKDVTGLLDLRVVGEEVDDALSVTVEFNPDVFLPATIHAFVTSWFGIVDLAINASATRLSSLPLDPALEVQVARVRARDASRRIVLASTFTATPLEAPLQFCLDRLALGSGIESAPFNQIIQQIVSPSGAVARNQSGLSVLLVRVSDWVIQGDSSVALRPLDPLAQAILALDGKNRLLVVCCPSSRRRLSDADAAGLERTFADSLAAIPSLEVLTSADLLHAIDVTNWDDHEADELGAVPYTEEFFAAVALVIARRAYRAFCPPPKVLCIDADNTLWRGVAAEDGADGVVFDEAHLELQRLLVAQSKGGKLLCICSKNEVGDVHQVFDRRTAEMPLKREHILSWKVNWEPKPANLVALAKELDLGLASFVFIDDNPLECAAVRSALPEVLTLNFPTASDAARSLLRNSWFFDARETTAEDQARTDMYRQEVARKAALREAPTLAGFIANLGLKVDVFEPSPTELVRVAQLTQRTNQFNLAPQRYDEAELGRSLAAGLRARAVRVSDRFGDYGIVGAVLFRAGQDCLNVESFLLSCRALGRGVENRMLMDLRDVALREGHKSIHLPFTPTSRNAPARAFVNQVAKHVSVAAVETTATLFLPISALADLPAVFNDANEVTVESAEAPAASNIDSEARASLARVSALELFATTLTSARSLQLASVPVGRRRATRSRFIAPRTPREEVITGIWSEVLNVELVGVLDSFFDLGGSSLAAIRLLSRVNQTTGTSLSLRDFFSEPTPAAMARAASGGGLLEQLPQVRPRPEDRFRPFPLTDVQQAYFVGRRSDLEIGGVACYVYYELEGRLDIGRFERAVNRLIERHDMFRAVIDDDGFQRVLPEVPRYSVRIYELGDLDSATVEAECLSVRGEMSHQVLPADRWPLFDLRASKLPNGSVRLHVGVDLLVADAGSFDIVGREIWYLYESPDAVLPPLSLTFRDFVLAVREMESGPLFARDRAYWLKVIETFPEPPTFPTAGNATDLAVPVFGRREGALSADKWASVLRGAARHGLTASALLLTAYSQVLGTWTASNRFAISATLFNRLPIHPEIDSIVGDFTSLAVVIAEWSPNESLESRARTIQKNLVDAIDHRLFSGVHLLRELVRQGRTAGAGSTPIAFTSTIGLSASNERPQGDLGALREVYGVSQTPQIWIDLQVMDAEDGGLHYRLDAVEHLFEEGVLDAIFGGFQKMLELLSNPGAFTARAFSLLPEAQLARRIAANQTQGQVPDSLLHEPFLRRVALDPEAPAVFAHDLTVNYAQLACGAAYVADQLLHNGLMPGEIVAISMRKGWQQVVAALGILIAGGAYLPVDPELPQERIAFMLADAHVSKVVVTERERLEPTWGGVTTFVVEREQLNYRGGPSRDRNKANPEDLAYVIYTSGSTGRPKGVMISHRGAQNTVVDINERFQIGPGDRILAISSLSFDLSVFDVFGALAAGGALVMPAPDNIRDPAALVRVASEKGVTIWNSVPALFELYVEALERTDPLVLPALRVVMLSGDWIPLGLPARTRRVFAGQAPDLISLGGATEASIWSIVYPIREIDPAWKSIPYGTPLKNQEFHVLDEGFRPCPDFVAGDLYIGGVGLALGYLGDEVKTNAAFVTHPETGQRIYRTGDRGRYLPSGEIEFLGRNDGQVKIQGYRIEVGEIEAVLDSLESVKRSVVVADGDRNRRRLVAYLVPESDNFDPEVVKTVLSTKLPTYMVPASLVVLDALPLSSNGKVDRASLRLVSSTSLAASTDVLEPTALEQEVVTIWEHVLDVKGVTPAHSFFDLGGNSLLALRVVARARENYGVDVPFRSLFDRPRLRDWVATFGDARVRKEAISTVRPVDRNGPLRVSFAQERLWFLYRLDPAGTAYNEQGAFLMVGTLDVDTLKLSFDHLVRRHELLRCTISERDGIPHLLISNESRCFVFSQPDQLTEHEVRDIAMTDLREPFDLESGPVLRLRILPVAADRHVVIVSMHHIVSDGWSMGVLARELTVIYASLRANRPVELKPLPIQYADYASWERQALTDEVLKNKASFFERGLEGIEALQLPCDHPRPPFFTGRGARLTVTVPEEFVVALRRVAEETKVTPFVVLLSIYAVFIGQLAATNDVTIGTPAANRGRKEFEGIFGFFLNMVPLRVNFGSTHTLRGLIAEARERTVEALAHQDLPFERIVDALRLPRDSSRTPVFQAMFVYQNTPPASLSLENISLDAFDLQAIAAKTDLCFTMREFDGAISRVLEIDYYVDIFTPTTIQKWANEFIDSFLERTSNLDAPLKPFVSRVDLHRQIFEVNDTKRQFAGPFVHEQISRQAALTPTNIAVTFGTDSISYALLEEKSNQLAHYLRERGARPETLVAVCLERSLELVISLLAIMKAGAAYLPIDPASPAGWVKETLADAQPAIALTSARTLPALGDAGRSAICVEDVAFQEHPSRPPQVLVSDDALAYVIYTSGSTGKPKGAMNTHGGLRNRLCWMQEALALREHDTVMQKTPYTFDVSVWEFFWPLTKGAKLAVAAPGGHMDPTYIRDLAETEGVTLMHFVPSMLAAFLEDLPPGCCTHLRTVVCSGEALSHELQQRALACLPGVSLMNLYGPTEAAIDVTLLDCTRSSERVVPIGFAAPNVVLRILDPWLRAISSGSLGELYLGGPQLARGYLHRPELTAERFVPSPTDEGERIYRTGDLARLRVGAEVEYLGRIDHQIKLRGQRIELGEIESRLLRHDRVASAVVVLREDDSHQQHLVAYVCPRERDGVTTEELKAFLALHLPTYMVPNVFMTLDALPLTSSGKTDRKALPPPVFTANKTYEAPQTETEIEVARIFGGVLSGRAIGLLENFFEGGGNSLSAMLVVSRIRKAFEIEFTLRDLFEHPTVKGLAQLVDAAQEEALLAGFDDDPNEN